MIPCPNLILREDPYFSSGSWKRVIEAFVSDLQYYLGTGIGELQFKFSSGLLFSFSKSFIDK